MRVSVMKLPFSVKRLGPKGQTTPEHLFCVSADGNGELVRSGESAKSALINGACGSDPKATRAGVQKLCDALNDVWRRYFDGTL